MSDAQGLTDRVFAVLDPDPTSPDLDTRGPDPAQWADQAARQEPAFDPGVGIVKGPDPAEWGEQ